MSNVDSSHPNFKDISGFKSGRLVAVRPVLRNSRRQTIWECRCDCGNSVEIVGASLTTGHSRSCGCLYSGSNRVTAKTSPEQFDTHGLSGSVEHKAWKAMWQRCTNPNDSGFEHYQTRTPPAEWEDFAAFYRDMGHRPKDKESIDRIDNDRPYGPGNCQWATREEQNNNKSTNLRVTYRGETQTLARLCRKLGLAYRLVYARVTRLGWSVQEAVETQVMTTAESNEKRASSR